MSRKNDLFFEMHETTFNTETYVYETSKDDLVVFLRTANMTGGFSCISRSTDGGKLFKWQSIDFYGYPLHALKLRDNRLLLT
jgi:hypothetical protein